MVGRAISIHALRGEGDHIDLDRPFILTISIHALRGEGDPSVPFWISDRLISIHALRGEGDWAGYGLFLYLLLFQSTPSEGRATFFDINSGSPVQLFQSTPSEGRAT